MLQITVLMQKEMETNLVTMWTDKDLMWKVKKALQVEDMEVHLPGPVRLDGLSSVFVRGSKNCSCDRIHCCRPQFSGTEPVSCTWKTGLVENPIFFGAPSLQDTDSYAEAIKIGVFFF